MGLRRGGGGPGRGQPDEQPAGRAGGKAEDHSPDRYKMREKLLSIGDDFWIETQRGRRAFKVDGKALRLRNTLVLEDPRGTPVYEIQSKVVAIKDNPGYIEAARPRRGHRQARAHLAAARPHDGQYG